MSTVAPEPSSQTPDDAEQHTVADAPAVQRPTPDALQLNMLKQVDPTGAPPTSATEGILTNLKNSCAAWYKA